jgi:hypothetical protein
MTHPCVVPHCPNHGTVRATLESRLGGGRLRAPEYAWICVVHQRQGGERPSRLLEICAEAAARVESPAELVAPTPRPYAKAEDREEVAVASPVLGSPELVIEKDLDLVIKPGPLVVGVDHGSVSPSVSIMQMVNSATMVAVNGPWKDEPPAALEAALGAIASRESVDSQEAKLSPAAEQALATGIEARHKRDMAAVARAKEEILRHLRSEGPTLSGPLLKISTVPHTSFNKGVRELLASGEVHCTGHGTGRVYDIGPVSRSSAPAVVQRRRAPSELTDDELKARIVGYLAQVGACKADAVLAYCGVRAGRCRQLIQELMADGTVVREGNGRASAYRLAEAPVPAPVTMEGLQAELAKERADREQLQVELERVRASVVAIVDRVAGALDCTTHEDLGDVLVRARTLVERSALLAKYEQTLETCDTPCHALSGPDQLNLIVGEWRQIGDRSGKHYRAWLQSDYIRCAILDSGHPLGDDSDPELTPLRLVRELVAENVAVRNAKANQAHRLRLAEAELEAERARALGIGEAADSAMDELGDIAHVLGCVEGEEPRPYEALLAALHDHETTRARLSGIEGELARLVRVAGVPRERLASRLEELVTTAQAAVTMVGTRKELLRRHDALTQLERCVVWRDSSADWPHPLLEEEIPVALHDELDLAIRARLEDIAFRGLEEAAPCGPVVAMHPRDLVSLDRSLEGAA